MKKNILYIEDNTDNLLLVKRVLNSHGYHVFGAKNGLEGISVAQTENVDLMMPGIDGFGLVEELRLDPRTRAVPIVVVSAKDISPEERKRLNGHIEAVFQKGSLQPRKFIDQVIQVIEDKNGEQG